MEYQNISNKALIHTYAAYYDYLTKQTYDQNMFT